MHVATKVAAIVRAEKFPLPTAYSLTVLMPRAEYRPTATLMIRKERKIIESKVNIKAPKNIKSILINYNLNYYHLGVKVILMRVNQLGNVMVCPGVRIFILSDGIFSSLIALVKSLSGSSYLSSVNSKVS